MANEVVGVAKALDQPKTHDANGSKMEWAVEDSLSGVPIVSHLGDEGGEKELVELRTRVLS
jgi:hypothetical protein